MLPPPRININLFNLEEPLPLPQIPTSPEEQHDWESKARLEENLGVASSRLPRRGYSDEDLCDERDAYEEETQPGAPDAADGMEGDFVEATAVVFPGGPEANVGL
jgi:hypothetical protein